VTWEPLFKLQIVDCKVQSAKFKTSPPDPLSLIRRGGTKGERFNLLLFVKQRGGLRRRKVIDSFQQS